MSDSLHAHALSQVNFKLIGKYNYDDIYSIDVTMIFYFILYG